MSNVRLEKITKYYAKNKVIEDLSILIKDGECFTFLGPSGCGKTVLLRLIAGFEQQNEGEIFIGENLVSSIKKGVHLPPEKRKIGVVFQDYAVWPHKTVFENIIYPLIIQGVNKIDANKRVTQVIKQVNLIGLENRLPFQLSGGQQQRVALARALASKPEIMLLDEPLCNLDANLREEMRFEIKDLQKNTGATIFYVTQDLEVALAISNRVAVLNKKGEIQQIGAPDEIYENPINPFVFQFMGVSNFIPAEIVKSRVYIKDCKLPVDFSSSLPEIKEDKEFVVACRPSDIELSKNGSPTKGKIKRKVFLGPIIDYRIELGNIEIRVQQDTQSALKKNLIFSEGSSCSIEFHDLKWYEKQSMMSLNESNEEE